MTFKRLKTAAMAAALSALALMPFQSQAALILTETTDFSNTSGLSASTSVGTLMEGTNTVSGSLAGECVFDSGIDCNNSSNGDTQDSILFNLPSNLELISASLTLSNVTAPSGMSVGVTSRFFDPTSTFLIFEFVSVEELLTPLTFLPFLPEGITEDFAFSIFGGRSSRTGDYAFDWDVAFDVRAVDGASPIPEPASIAMLGLGLIGLTALRRRKQRTDAY